MGDLTFMNTILENPCEGDIIILNDLSLWIVKGCFHPMNYTIALPRIINGKKLKRLREMYRVVARYYAHFLKYIPELGLRAPLVPKGFIRTFYHALSTKCVEGLSRLHNICRELLDIIESNCSTECGITGSLLGGYYVDSSDIDLICLDRPKLYDCLLKLQSEGVLTPLTEDVFGSELVDVNEGLDSRSHLKLITHKVLQGTYKGYRYTLRIINCSRLNNYLGPYDYVLRVPKAVLKVVTTDYRTPSIFDVDIIKLPLSEYIMRNRGRSLCISHRLRYTEIPIGALMLVSNALIMVKRDVVIFNLDFSDYVVTFIP